MSFVTVIVELGLNGPPLVGEDMVGNCGVVSHLCSLP